MIESSRPLEPIEHLQTIKELARRRIQAAILDGSLKSGEEINQAELARQLGISRGPLREALVELERDGLVINHPHRSTIVAPFSLDDIQELVDLRCLLEGYSASRIVEQGISIEPLEKVFAQMVALEGKGTLDEFAEAEVDFHTTLIHLTGRKHLASMWTRIITLFRRFLRAGVLYTNQVETHKAFLDALRSNDAALAAEAARQHVWKAYQEVMSEFKKST